MADPSTEALDVRFRRSLLVLNRRVGAELLVTTPGDESVHELSGGAMAIWGDLAEPRTTRELVDAMASMHGVDPDEIAEDVAGCLVTLMACGAVEEVADLDG